jgi:16S rRNA (guanine966-N2)-methyltransferase
MRVIGGRFKGRRFNPPKFFKARPTTDFAKESLFNLINNEIDLVGTRVLDLFAGTGSIRKNPVQVIAQDKTCDKN